MRFLSLAAALMVAPDASAQSFKENSRKRWRKYFRRNKAFPHLYNSTGYVVTYPVEFFKPHSTRAGVLFKVFCLTL